MMQIITEHYVATLLLIIQFFNTLLHPLYHTFRLRNSSVQVRKPFDLHPDKNRPMSLVFGIDHLHVNKIGEYSSQL